MGLRERAMRLSLKTSICQSHPLKHSTGSEQAVRDGVSELYHVYDFMSQYFGLSQALLTITMGQQAFIIVETDRADLYPRISAQPSPSSEFQPKD